MYLGCTFVATQNALVKHLGTCRFWLSLLPKRFQLRSDSKVPLSFLGACSESIALFGGRVNITRIGSANGSPTLIFQDERQQEWLDACVADRYIDRG